MTALREQVCERASGVDVRIAGEPCRLDPSGALFMPERGLLVVADLHLEKGSSLARRGALLPPYDTGATLARLAEVLGHYDPASIVALGDSFHDRRGPERLLPADRARLADLAAGRDWTWITGNHDPVVPPSLPGRSADALAVGPLVLRHHPRPGAERELAGHLHPVAKVVLFGRGVRARAFLTDGERCVLPAFGAYAGGLNACDPAFAPIFPRGFTAHVIGRSRMFTIARAALCRD